MKELDELLVSDSNDLLDTLPSYQKDIIEVFLSKTGNNFDAAADLWLKSSPNNTAKFGAEQPKNLYLEKFKEELEKFLCGDDKYNEERSSMAAHTDKSKDYIIMVLSTSIGPALGAAGTFIAPLIVLFLSSLSRMGLNAWCEMRKQSRGASETS